MKGIEERKETEIYLESLRETFKKIANWKSLDHNDVYGFWFNVFMVILNRIVQQLCKWLYETKYFWINARQNLPWSEKMPPPKRNKQTKQVQTDNVSANGVETPDCTKWENEFIKYFNTVDFFPMNRKVAAKERESLYMQ